MIKTVTGYFNSIPAADVDTALLETSKQGFGGLRQSLNDFNTYVGSEEELKGKRFLDVAEKALGDAWQGARTVQNWKDPSDVLAAGTARTIEGGLKGIGAVASAT